MAEIVVKLVNGELAGKTAQSINKEVSAAALALKKAEVGTKEWVKANEKLEGAKQLQADLKKQIEGTASASDLLKKSFNKLPGAEFFNKIGESFGMMKSGVGGLISQFGLLKTAIASTGIGLLVLALSSLISYFTSTQEGIDKVTAVTRPLKVIFESLVGVLQNLGGKIFKQLSEAIENPKQALKDLGQILLDNVINRFKAFALIGPAIKKIFSKDWKEGLEDLSNAALQAATGVEDVIGKVTGAAKALVNIVDEAAKRGKLIDDLKKQIERDELNQITRSKEIELGIKKQKDIVEDVTKSWDERRLAAEKALALQNLGLNLELSLLDKRIATMKLDQKSNDTLIDGKKELAELEAKKLELEARSTEQSIEFKKKITEFDKGQAAEQLAITQNLENLRLQTLKEGVDKEIAQVELDTERKIESLKGTAEQILEQKLLLEEIELQSIQEIRDKYAAEQAEKDKKAKEDQEKSDNDAADKKKKQLEELASFEEEIEQIKLSTSQDVATGIGNIIAQTTKNQKAAIAIKKTLALAEIGIGLQQQTTANAVAGAKISASAPPFSVPVGIAYTAAANTRAIVGAAISAAKVLIFKKGGIPDGVLSGPSHEQGGIPLVAEGKEIILTKGVYSNPALRNAASAINVAGGGRSFAAGGVVNPLDRSRGAVASGRAGSSSSIQLQDTDAIARRVMEMSEGFIYKIQVNNNLQDTNKGLGVLNQLKAEADV